MTDPSCIYCGDGTMGCDTRGLACVVRPLRVAQEPRYPADEPVRSNRTLSARQPHPDGPYVYQVGGDMPESPLPIGGRITMPTDDEKAAFASEIARVLSGAVLHSDPTMQMAEPSPLEQKKLVEDSIRVVLEDWPEHHVALLVYHLRIAKWDQSRIRTVLKKAGWWSL